MNNKHCLINLESHKELNLEILDIQLLIVFVILFNYLQIIQQSTKHQDNTEIVQ
jgi:hypothetical protein